ncbi:MAG TPA: ATP-binding protein, partial [Chthoniobacteraceae bacterium]
QRFEVRTEPIEPPPHCDGLAIQRALINLLDNASKFSPPDSAIQVRAEAANAAHWILAVADRGPGIAPEERDRIFERFYRIGSELRREAPGAGIGLSVVRHIVEGHGGEAFVEPAPDGGSIFILRLPLQPPAN